ncbi:Cna B-type domain-containing protein [Lactobacillus helveticus]|uniref:Gram-positive cocci surface proteins LPxTG domain-containing protein n=5 Tax=Lactobacillus helveticus TaxID=1587 RepID=A0AAC8W9Z9_LACHE|nr:Cna B-type domain-containing protein [Lactobacillus helveticus]ALI53347.1 hypothetical protein ALV80_10270 [Lactobacillus helveticus]
MSNKSRHRRLLFMMGLVLFSLLGSIWISSNSGMTVYADSKTKITQNGTGSGSVIKQPGISTGNTNSSNDQTSHNKEAQPRALAKQNKDRSMPSSPLSKRPNSVNNITNSVGHADSKTNITQNGTGSGSVIKQPGISTGNTNSSNDQTSHNKEAQPRVLAKQNKDRSMPSSPLSKRPNSVNNITNSVGHADSKTNITQNGTGSGPSKQVNTKEDDRDWGDQFITKAELQDKSGNLKTDFGIYDDMQAAWNFVIPANKAKSGDTMTVAIPSVLTLATMTNFDITDAGGTVIGRAAANPNTGKVPITLTDAVKNNHNTITGSFKLWVHWNADKIEKNKLVSVNWGTSGSTNIHVDPSNGPDPNEVLYKWGWYDTNNPYIIHWRVRINYAGKTINQAVYTDRVDDNQALVSGSVSVYKIKYQSDGRNFNILSTYPSSSTIENGTSGFTTTLGDILSSTVVIDYKTKITNNGISAHYKNNGKLAGSNIEKQTIDVYSPINGGNGNADTIITISGTKTWKDNNNQDGIRPSSITVNLLANGQQYASKKVSASDNWQYRFDNLPTYANGKKITYTVTENAGDGYTSTVARTVDGYNVTNNHTPATVKVSVTKTWKDNNNQDGIRPSSITVNLLANGQQYASKKVSASDNWQYRFDNLPAYANGKKITYTVTENAGDGYTSTVARTVDGYNVTNNHTPATVKVSVTKTWKDNNNQDGIRPSSITVNLLANGQQYASKKVSASDNWQYRFDNLPAYANGKKITYTVKEDAVSGYTSTVDGYNITNTHNPKPQVPNKPTTPKPQVPNKPTTPKPQVPNKPTTPKEPQVPNNGNKVTPKAYTQGKTYEKTGKLPQTGDESSMGMMLIGLVTLLLSLGLVVISRFTI